MAEFIRIKMWPDNGWALLYCLMGSTQWTPQCSFFPPIHTKLLCFFVFFSLNIDTISTSNLNFKSIYIKNCVLNLTKKIEQFVFKRK